MPRSLDIGFASDIANSTTWNALFNSQKEYIEVFRNTDVSQTIEHHHNWIEETYGIRWDGGIKIVILDEKKFIHMLLKHG